MPSLCDRKKAGHFSVKTITPNMVFVKAVTAISADTFLINLLIIGKDRQLSGVCSHSILSTSTKSYHMQPKGLSSSIQSALPARLRSAMIFL